MKGVGRNKPYKTIHKRSLVFVHNVHVSSIERERMGDRQTDRQRDRDSQTDRDRQREGEGAVVHLTVRVAVMS